MASPIPLHELMVRQLRLYCGQTVERRPHRSQRTIIGVVAEQAGPRWALALGAAAALSAAGLGTATLTRLSHPGVRPWPRWR